MNYEKEYKKYLISSVLDNANNKIASTSFISAFAIYLGISDFSIGIYTVLDTITNVFQIFAAPLFSRIGQSKKVVLTNYSIYRISSVCFAVIPFVSNNISVRTTLFFIFASVYAITGEMGYITFVNWRMSLLKKEDRTKFAATKNMYKNTIVLAFSLFMGVILDKFAQHGYELYGFMILFFIVFLITFIDIAIRIITYKPLIKENKITIKNTIKIPAQDKKFRKIIVICGINRFANGIGIMYLNVFLLRYLKISYVYYSLLNIIINLSEAISSKHWANRANDRNWKNVILPMCIIFVFAFLGLFITPNKILKFILPLIYLLLGVGNGAYEIFDNVAIYEASQDKLQTSYVTFERFIEGIITAIIPLLSYTILSENNNAINITFVLAIFSYLILGIYSGIMKSKKLY